MPSTETAAAPARTIGYASGLLLFAGLTIVWGCNWPFMKIALEQVPVWWFRSGCVIAGGFGLLLVSAVGGLRLLPKASEVPALIVCASFAIVGWHMLTGYGLTHMPAGRAAIIANTMPVWAAVFASFLLSERLTSDKIAGLVFGLMGLGILIGPDIIVVRTAPLGAAFMVCAAMSWAMGTVLFKRTAWTTDVSVTAGWMLTIGAIPITIGAICLEPFPDLSGFHADTW